MPAPITTKPGLPATQTLAATNPTAAAVVLLRSSGMLCSCVRICHWSACLPAGTKLVCALGPSSHSVPVLEAMLNAGMVGARIDLTWGGLEFHRESLRALNVSPCEHDRGVAGGTAAAGWRMGCWDWGLAGPYGNGEERLAGALAMGWTMRDCLGVGVCCRLLGSSSSG